MQSVPAETPQQPATRQRRWFRQAVALFVFGIIAFLYHSFFTLSVVRGKSMEPTFHDGQVVLVGKGGMLFGPLKHGDVVVFTRNGELLVKRVVALPYEIAPDGTQVPANHIYVVGDNLEVSEDSRAFGPIPLSSVIGKVLY
ncbi:MAG: signal peptidase I [Armatimonadota bacterium]|nr:signal peptidase I [bacterium]MCS7309754.1 signal peptidase I [Armatimonadota bacterium]MDW8291050.1 signal peptidase I [Armatimonadota bacterium]